jgi:hypothetical protein
VPVPEKGAGGEMVTEVTSSFVSVRSKAFGTALTLVVRMIDNLPRISNIEAEKAKAQRDRSAAQTTGAILYA